jgi:RNA polymerase sigma-70 factor, ECF subfamily
MQEPSIDIIQKASKGDLKAFEEIYRTTCGFVYSCALRVAGNSSDAEEITQEVYLKVHKYLEKFEFRSTLKTWIYRITVNTAINYAKKMKREMPAHKDIDDHPGAGVTVSVNDIIENSDNQRVLHTLLDVLNPEQKSCILLREIEGLDYKEIAETLGININTVRSRLKRGRQALMASTASEVIKNEL